MSIKELFTRMSGRITYQELVVSELNEAKCAKLEAESARDYAGSIVAYHDLRIARLSEYLNATTTNKSKN